MLCATRGEAGESRVPTEDLAGLREHELRTAGAILGVGEVRLLDHVDSGMDGEPAAGTLAAADLERVVAEVLAAIEELRPDVVVTLDASDGHRDHEVIRDATLIAVDRAEHPPGRHLPEVPGPLVDGRGGPSTCGPRAAATRISPSVSWAPPTRTSPSGSTSTEQLTTRWEAIRAHASQASPYDDLTPELQHEFLATDRLKLVRGTDLLAP